MFSESFDFDQQFSDLDLGGRERKGGGVTLHRQLQHNGIADCILKNVGDEDTPNRHCTVGNKCLSILSWTAGICSWNLELGERGSKDSLMRSGIQLLEYQMWWGGGFIRKINYQACLAHLLMFLPICLSRFVWYSPHPPTNLQSGQTPIPRLTCSGLANLTTNFPAAINYQACLVHHPFMFMAMITAMVQCFPTQSCALGYNSACWTGNNPNS